MIEVIYADVAIGAAENAAYSDTGRQSYSNTDNLSNGAEGKKIATGEVGRWALNGTVDILDAVDADYGYVSAEQSDADGVFNGDVGVDVLFSQKYTSGGLTITFDTHEDVIYTVKVSWYKDEILLKEELVEATGEKIIDSLVEMYNKIVIRFIKSNKPYRFARIQQFVFGIGRRFTQENGLGSVNLSQVVDHVSNEIGIDSGKIVLRSTKDNSYIFQSRQAFKIYRDSALVCSLFLDDATVNGGKYDVSCESAIGVLDEQSFSPVMWFDKNAYEAAVEIVGDDFEVDMEDALKNETVSGLIPEGTRREALHQLLFALGATCSTSGTEKIRIFKFGNETKEIPREVAYASVKVKRPSIVTAVELEWHEYSTTGVEGMTTMNVNGVTYYQTVGVVRKENTDILAGTKSNIKTVSGATLVTREAAERLIDSIYDYHVNNAVLSEKILVTDEQPGDKVVSYDYAGRKFEGAIVSMQTALTNVSASTIEVRGRYVTD